MDPQEKHHFVAQSESQVQLHSIHACRGTHFAENVPHLKRIDPKPSNISVCGTLCMSGTEQLTRIQQGMQQIRKFPKLSEDARALRRS
jgi:hypothetical protein